MTALIEITKIRAAAVAAQDVGMPIRVNTTVPGKSRRIDPRRAIRFE
jgi:hypothetical protein